MKIDDAGARARFRFPFADDLRRAVNGVAFEQWVREFDVGHAEIGDGGAHRHVRHLNADHESEREQRVHQGLPPVGLGLAEMTVDVQRLRIERHVGEQHVVHLRHGARVSVLIGLADLEILEIRGRRVCAAGSFQPSISSGKPSQRGVWEPSLPFVYHNSPMLGRLAGNVCVRVITHKTRSSHGPTRWPFIRLLPAHHK